MNPCGCWVDLLRSCYRTKARLVEGSSELTDIDWFFAPEGARYLDLESAIGSLVWNSEIEFPEGIGEVSRVREWIPSTNERHYQGKCYTGEPLWFLNGVPPEHAATYPECSECALFTVGGGLLLGGNGSHTSPVGQVGLGGLRLGGVGSHVGPRTDQGNGGLLVGGVGSSIAELSQLGHGGLLVGGVGTHYATSAQLGQGGLLVGGVGKDNAPVRQTGKGGLLVGGAGSGSGTHTNAGRGGLLVGGKGH